MSRPSSLPRRVGLMPTTVAPHKAAAPSSSQNSGTLSSNTPTWKGPSAGFCESRNAARCAHNRTSSSYDQVSSSNRKPGAGSFARARRNVAIVSTTSVCQGSRREHRLRRALEPPTEVGEGGAATDEPDQVGEAHRFEHFDHARPVRHVEVTEREVDPTADEGVEVFLMFEDARVERHDGAGHCGGEVRERRDRRAQPVYEVEDAIG